MTEYFIEAWNKQVNDQFKKTGINQSEWKASGRATKANPNKEDDNWWLVNGAKMFDNWVAFRNGNNGWKLWDYNGTPAIELGLTPIWNDIPVQMHLDRVMVNPDGELVVLDIKTGSRTPTSDLQLAFYAAGMEEMLGIRPRWGAYWMAREGIVSEMIDLDRYTKDDIIDIITKFDKARKENIFLPNFSHCIMCNLKTKCKWKNGENK